MTRLLYALLISLAITLTTLFVNPSLLPSAKPLPSEPGTTPIMRVTPKLNTASPVISALFIGNSHTFFYNMPQMIAFIAQSDPANTYTLEIQAHTAPGETLKGHWKKGTALSLITIRHWDKIILQEQSVWPLYSNGIKDTYAYIMKFKALTQGKPTETLLFKTWPRQKDSLWYSDPKQKNFFKSYETSRNNIDIQTEIMARRTNVTPILVGDYWTFINSQHPEINLYNPDGNHTSLAGVYLNALIFYRALTGNDPKNATYAPYGLDRETAKKLREIASYGEIK